MKVNIGPYKDGNKKRKVKIKIDGYDIWSMDHTLAMIILPMLKKLKKAKCGTPFIDDEDVPDGKNLRSTEAPPKENEWDTDDNFHKRWKYVLKEMIWTFKQLQDWKSDSKFYDHSGVDNDANINIQMGQLKVDREGLKKHEERIDNGLRLFGKYFRALWT